MLPNLFYFNPICETEIANGSPYFSANKKLIYFQEKMANLPMFYAQADDIVLVPAPLPDSFLQTMEDNKFIIPKFCSLEEIKTSKIKLNEIKPWGWSPATHRKFSEIKKQCAPSFHQKKNAYWTNKQKDIYSRAFALSILEKVQEKANNKFPLLSETENPKICNEINEIFEQIEKGGNFVIKAPFSSSGRGLLLINKNNLRKFHSQWIGGIIKKQGFVTIEKWQNKILDFSFHYRIENKKIYTEGNTWFCTDANGRYVGNYIGKISEFINNDALSFIKSFLADLNLLIEKTLSESILAEIYCGFIGVDAMICKDAENKFFVHPCLEINCRYTMGIVSNSLKRFIADDKKATFNIYSDRNKSFENFIKSAKNNKNIETIPLNPLEKNCKVGAFIQIFNS